MDDGTDFSDVWLALPGFRVTATTDDGEELLVAIEMCRQTRRRAVLPAG